MELSKIYKAILSLAGIEADDEDKIFTKIKGENHYIKHGGKDIYLPSKKAASTAALNNGLIFNPLNENVLVKKDVVFAKIADKIIADFNTIIGTWVYALAKHMEQNAEAATKMSPSMLNIIKEVGEVPKDFSARMMMFAAGCSEGNINYRYLSYKITGSTSGKDKDFNKKCVIWSPYKKNMDALYTGDWSQKEDDKKRIAGAVLRKSDGKPFDKILSQILPGLKEDSYNGYSLSQISPTVDSFLKSIKLILTDLAAFHNKVKSVDDFEWPDYDLSWVKFMENVDKHTSTIRNMPNDCVNIPVVEKAEIVNTTSIVQNKANERLMRDSMPSSIPPWEDEPKQIIQPQKKVSSSAPTVEDLISGKIAPAPGLMSQAMRDSTQNNAGVGAPTVMSILGNMPQQMQYRVAPVQTLMSGSLTQNKFSPTTIAQVPSMTNMSGIRISGMGGF